jgi:hypothetical protein
MKKVKSNRRCGVERREFHYIAYVPRKEEMVKTDESLKMERKFLW